jgi:hypothetical protein
LTPGNRRIGHVLKPPDGWIKGVTSFLKPGEAEVTKEFLKSLSHISGPKGSQAVAV